MAALTSQSLYLDTTMSSAASQSGRSSMSDTVCGSEPSTPVKAEPVQKEKKQKKKPKPTPKVERPFFQSLGDELLKSTKPHLAPTMCPLPKMPPMPEDPIVPTHTSDESDSFSIWSGISGHYAKRSKSAVSLVSSQRSIKSNFSGIARIMHDARESTIKRRANGTIYSLQEAASVTTLEDLILRYGRVAHMGVRDNSYQFWMNSNQTAAVHFKVLDRVAVLGGDPLCHPDRVALTLKEFVTFCKKVGWKTAVIGGSSQMVEIAKQKKWTCMNFGTESVLNPQTNEVLLGKAGKRIVTQCKQLLDPTRGGTSIHTYSPAYGRDPTLESDLRTLYDDWRNERNSSRESQAFVTVFDLFAMPSLMTFLYTKDKNGKVNGFAALRKLGAVEGYHIDPFIQTSSAPRGVSDLLIFGSLALLNAQGCTYLSLGYEPVTELSEIWGLPSIFHSTTKKVYKHVFGKIPVGGKEAFHARWKPDNPQETSLYLVFIGKIPSPRYMLAMTHFANISLRKIVASDWEAWVAKKDKVEARSEEPREQQQQQQKKESSEVSQSDTVMQVVNVQVLRPKTATAVPTKNVKVSAMAITLSERPSSSSGLSV